MICVFSITEMNCSNWCINENISDNWWKLEQLKNCNINIKKFNWKENLKSKSNFFFSFFLSPLILPDIIDNRKITITNLFYNLTYKCKFKSQEKKNKFCIKLKQEAQNCSQFWKWFLNITNSLNNSWPDIYLWLGISVSIIKNICYLMKLFFIKFSR